MIVVEHCTTNERRKEDVMTREIELQRKIVELGHANQALQEALSRVEQQRDDIYAEYQNLVQVIRSNPSEHDLLALKGKVIKLEKLLDEEVPGWQFKMHGHDHDAKREEAIAHRA